MSGGYYLRDLRGGRSAALATMIGITLFASTQAATITLLDDTWADGTRTNTNLPIESAVYVGPNAAVANTSVAVGSLTQAQSGSSQRIHTYFAPDGSPVNLNVGDKLTATVEFTSGTLSNSTSRNFRVGLFSTPSVSHVTTDGTNDTGGTGDPWQSAIGYGANFFLTSSPGTTQLFQIGKRTNIGGGNLLGSTGDYAQSMAGGGVAAAASNTDYTLYIELVRTAIDELNVTYKLSDASGVLASHTVTDDAANFGTVVNATLPYTSFDMLAFRFSSNAGVSSPLTFTRFKVELETAFVIPEPASALLLGFAGLALALVRRREC